jgi:hypothetical protein
MDLPQNDMLTRLLIALLPTGNPLALTSTKWHTPHPPSLKYLEHGNGAKFSVAAMI